MIALALDRDGRVTFANDFLLDLTGWSREDLLGRDWFATFVPDPEEPRRAFLAGLESGSFPARVENEILTRSGERHLISWSNSPLLDDEGRVEGTISLGQDVTDERRLREQLLHAQKLEAVGRLAGGIAHDFNNLLTAIGGYSEFLAASFDESDPRRGDALEIVRAAGRATALTGQLLAFSRRQVQRQEVLDLGEVLVAVEKLLSRLLGAGVELVTSAEPGCLVTADRSQLEQVITNLAVNARDAMPGGGRLELAVSRAGEWVELLVSDTGTGMDTQTLSHVFEPFFTTKEAGKGTGLGLATAYGIVTQSGGEISVTSAPGEGTRFRVRLPLGVAEALEREREDEEPSPRAGSECVLLAEDEETIRRLVTEVLTRNGYRVYAAATGDEALELLERHGAIVKLLLTDVVMPGMSGPDLARAAHRLNPHLRVLFTSGYTSKPDEAFEDPEVEFIGKPFSPQALVAKVREVLDAE